MARLPGHEARRLVFYRHLTGSDLNEHQGQRTVSLYVRPMEYCTRIRSVWPTVRDEIAFADKLATYKALGFDGVQMHDDDVVPYGGTWHETEQGAKRVKKMLDDHGLFCEFIAPRLWEDPHTIEAALPATRRKTANTPSIVHAAPWTSLR